MIGLILAKPAKFLIDTFGFESEVSNVVKTLTAGIIPQELYFPKNLKKFLNNINPMLTISSDKYLRYDDLPKPTKIIPDNKDAKITWKYGKILVPENLKKHYEYARFKLVKSGLFGQAILSNFENRKKILKLERNNEDKDKLQFGKKDEEIIMWDPRSGIKDPHDKWILPAWASLAHEMGHAIFYDKIPQTEKLITSVEEASPGILIDGIPPQEYLNMSQIEWPLCRANNFGVRHYLIGEEVKYYDNSVDCFQPAYLA